MSMGYRNLYEFTVQEVGSDEVKRVLLDSYAVWEDLGHGMLQPVSSTQTTWPWLKSLPVGAGVCTGGRIYRRLSTEATPCHTSMNSRR